MKTTIALALSLAFLIVFACNQPAADTTETEIAAEDEGMSEQEVVEYGEYLVTIGGCHDCHTPKKMTDKGPEPDMAYALSGHPASQPLGEYDPEFVQGGDWFLINGSLTAFVGPWGNTYAANLTPHETGLGNWTYEHFEKALREGKHKGLEDGRPIMPPMPWQNLVNIKEKDLKAVWTYLQSIPPIDNKVPEYAPPGPPPSEG